MRLAAIVAFVGAVILSAPATAETRVFVIDNTPDGYGVDQCLATGARCGIVVANAYCQSRDFAGAASFRKVDRSEVTGSVEAASAVVSEASALVAIECAR
jgi:hypothetical protein